MSDDLDFTGWVRDQKSIRKRLLVLRRREERTALLLDWYRKTYDLARAEFDKGVLPTVFANAVHDTLKLGDEEVGSAILSFKSNSHGQSR